MDIWGQKRLFGLFTCRAEKLREGRAALVVAAAFCWAATAAAAAAAARGGKSSIPFMFMFLGLIVCVMWLLVVGGRGAQFHYMLSRKFFVV